MITEQDKDTTRPPIFDMTDEQLAQTADYDFTAEEPKHQTGQKTINATGPD